jgi:peptide deformylase
MNNTKLTYLGDSVLRRTAQTINNPESAETAALAQTMIDTMHTHHGVGLAAPQIGISLQLIIFHVPEDRADDRPVPLQILINPTFTALSPDITLGLEGCLSLPGLRGLVPRHDYIGYHGYDLTGQLVEREAHGFHARVVQHEIDHLNGVMYLDRMLDFDTLVHESVIVRKSQHSPALAPKPLASKDQS